MIGPPFKPRRTPASFFVICHLHLKTCTATRTCTRNRNELRKFKLNKSPIKPDNNHFHQLIFLYFKDSLKLKTLISNNLGANVINLYNLIMLYIGSLSVSDTQFQITLIILNVLVYVFVYIKLYKKNIKNISL